MLFQRGNDEWLHLVGFHSRKFSTPTITYEIQKK
jgi:hypothetical protein